MYYLCVVKGISDGTESREVLKFTDLISAKATLHSRLGSAMADTNCTFAFASILNNQGVVLARDSFERPTETEEETENV